MKKCVLTLVDFDPSEQKDGEHIIPASLGGNLKSRFIISSEANNQTGKLDAALEKVFQLLKAQFRIANERDRSNIRKYSYTSDNGEKIIWDSENYTGTLAHQVIEEIISGDNELKIKITLPYESNEDKVRAKAVKVFQTIGERKWKKPFKIQSQEYLVRKFSIPKISAKINFDKDSLRAIIKTGFLFAAHKFGSENFISSEYDFLREIILGQRDPDDAIWISPPGSSKLLVNIDPPNHVITTFVRNGRLWVCVGYFSGFIFFVDLGILPYNIDQKEQLIIFDPISYSVQEVNDINFSKLIEEHVLNLPPEERLCSLEDHKFGVKRVLDTWSAKFRIPSLNFLTNRAIKSFNLKEDTILDDELTGNIIQAIVQEVLKFYSPKTSD